MSLHALVEFDPEKYHEHPDLFRGQYLVLKCDPLYWDIAIKELQKLAKANDKRIESGRDTIKLELALDVDYRHRTLSQNAWFWEACTLKANILNGKRSAWTDREGIKWRDAESITPEMVHADWMEQWATRGTLIVERSILGPMKYMLERECGHVMKETPIDIYKVELEIWKTTSFLDTKEFSDLQKKCIDDLLSLGVVQEYALEFQRLMPEEK